MRFPMRGIVAERRVTVPELKGGVDVSRPPHRVADDRLTVCRNLWWKDGALRTRPGFYTDGTRQVMWQGEETEPRYLPTADGRYVLYTHGAGVLKLLTADGAPTGVVFEQSVGQANLLAEYTGDDALPGTTYLGDGGFLIFAENGGIWAADRSGRMVDLRELVYVPLVFTTGSLSADENTPTDCVLFEGFNLLTNRFRGRFTTDGKGAYANLPTGSLSDAYMLQADYTHIDGAVYTWRVYPDELQATENGWVTAADTVILPIADGTVTVGVQVHPAAGRLRFVTRQEDAWVSYPLPAAGFSSNLEITAVKAGVSKASAVTEMRFAAWFGGTQGGTRLFAAGHPDHPHLVRWSDVNRPLYFPENSFAYVGSGHQAITAFAKQGSSLVIFKEQEIYAMGYAYRETDSEAVAAGSTVDVTADAYFPLTQLHGSVGCDLPNTVCCCGNRLVWADSGGRVYMLTSLSALSETGVRVLSRPITSLLAAETSTIAGAALYQGQYLLLWGRHMYLFDYTDGFDSDEPAWYRWEVALTSYRQTTSGGAFVQQQVQPLRLFGNGREAFLIGRGEQYYSYRLTGRTDTAYTYPYTYKPTFAEVPIRAAFATKRFDFGREERYKAVERLYLTLELAADTTVMLTYETERGSTPDPQVLRAFDTTAEVTAAVSPHERRCRSFGVRADITGAAAVGGLIMGIRMMGEVT